MSVRCPYLRVMINESYLKLNTSAEETSEEASKNQESSTDVIASALDNEADMDDGIHSHVMIPKNK